MGFDLPTNNIPGNPGDAERPRCHYRDAVWKDLVTRNALGVMDGLVIMRLFIGLFVVPYVILACSLNQNKTREVFSGK